MEPPSATSTAYPIKGEGNLKSRLIIGILILACLFLPLFLKQPYYLYLINLTGIHAILILGLNLLVGFAVMVSLGHAGFFAIGAYLSTKIVMNLHLPWILGLLGGGAGALSEDSS